MPLLDVLGAVQNFPRTSTRVSTPSRPPPFTFVVGACPIILFPVVPCRALPHAAMHCMIRSFLVRGEDGMHSSPSRRYGSTRKPRVRLIPGKAISVHSLSWVTSVRQRLALHSTNNYIFVREATELAPSCTHYFVDASKCADKRGIKYLLARNIARQLDSSGQILLNVFVCVYSGRGTPGCRKDPAPRWRSS